MPLTREFKATVQADLRRDPAFRAAMLSEAVEAFLGGDLETGKSVLRDYVNATIGFSKLASLTGTPPKSLMRMFSAAGNPRADNLFAVIEQLQRATGVGFEVKPLVRRPRRDASAKRRAA